MSDELQSNAIKFLIGFLSVIGARYFPADINAQFTQYLPSIASGIVAIGLFLYGAYMHRGQKLVPTAATAILLPSGPEPKNTTLDLTPMTGLAKVVGVALLAVVLLGTIPAFAQPKKTTAATPATPQSVAAAIQKAAIPDLNYAIQLATAANTLQSKVRLQCYQAVLAAVNPPNAPTTSPPTPDLVTQVEQFAELVDGLQPTSPIFVQCAGAAQLAQLSVLSFVNAIVTGAASAAVLAPKL